MNIQIPGAVMGIARWLAEQGCIVAISMGDTDMWEVDYAYKGRIQPTIYVPESGRIVWPKGSDFELVMRFLEGGKP